jgi:hypothetical protein
MGVHQTRYQRQAAEVADIGTFGNSNGTHGAYGHDFAIAYHDHAFGNGWPIHWVNCGSSQHNGRRSHAQQGQQAKRVHGHKSFFTANGAVIAI